MRLVCRLTYAVQVNQEMKFKQKVHGTERVVDCLGQDVPAVNQSEKIYS